MPSLAPMNERYARPEWVKRMNRMTDSVGGDARLLVPIDADELLEEAVKATGGEPVHDFGEPRWREDFRALAHALDRSPMHLLGRLMSKQELLRGLRTRLLLGRAVAENPAIEAEKVEEPMIVTGPARSGTTILFELLWLDPGLRAPVASETLHPLPIPEEDSVAAAFDRTQAEQEFWADVQPEFAAIHELRSDLPVECVTLTLPSFVGSHWAMIASLGDWAPDFARNYEYEYRALQVMQHGRTRKNWLLKTPGHLMTLDLLFARFPDAWVVQTHRDPARTMPSTVSTTAMVQWLRMDEIQLDLLAEIIRAAFAGGLNQTVDSRRDGSLPDRFVDVHFRDLLRDPVETVRRAYAGMERDLDDEHAEAIRRYLAEKPQGKFGKHRYTPEEWGFTAETVRQELAPYIEHFGVELE